MALEEGKHNPLSMLVWKHWLKTGLPLSKKEARTRFAKLDPEDSFEDHLNEGALADCDLVTYYVEDKTLIRLKGWIPSREWTRRQLQRVASSMTCWAWCREQVDVGGYLPAQGVQ